MNYPDSLKKLIDSLKKLYEIYEKFIKKEEII